MPRSKASVFEGQGPWTRAEHERFLVASKLYPYGPWKLIAAHVETRNVRQTQTHAQKYKEKLARWDRGLCRRRKISFDALDDHRPRFLEKAPRTKKKFKAKVHAKVSKPNIAFTEIEPLAFQTDDDVDLAGSASPCQVDILPSLSESLDYLMEVFEMVE